MPEGKKPSANAVVAIVAIVLLVIALVYAASQQPGRASSFCGGRKPCRPYLSERDNFTGDSGAWAAGDSGAWAAGVERDAIGVLNGH